MLRSSYQKPTMPSFLCLQTIWRCPVDFWQSSEPKWFQSSHRQFSAARYQLILYLFSLEIHCFSREIFSQISQAPLFWSLVWGRRRKLLWGNSVTSHMEMQQLIPDRGGINHSHCFALFNRFNFDDSRTFIMVYLCQWFAEKRLKDDVWRVSDTHQEKGVRARFRCEQVFRQKRTTVLSSIFVNWACFEKQRFFAF